MDEKKIEKKNEGTIDFHAINKIIDIGAETIPNAENICVLLSCCKYISKLDLSRGTGNCHKDIHRRN